MVRLATQDEFALLYEYAGPREPWLAHADALGARVIRLMVYSSDLHRRGWDYLDGAVNAARGAGFDVYLTITGTPRWHADQPGPVTTLDPKPGAYAALVHAVVDRYKDRVKKFAIWNEPNHPAFLEVSHGIKADYYSKLWSAGAEAARDAHPRVQLLYGELTGGGDALGFLRRSTRNGFTAHGFAWHPYQFKTAPDKRVGANAGIGNVDRVAVALKRLAHEKRLTTPSGYSLPMHITEFGYYPEGYRLGLREKTRSAWTRMAWERAKAYGVQTFLYYHLRHAEPGVAWNTGIVRADGSRDQTFKALQACAR